MIICIDAEKVSDKTKHLFFIKTFSKLEVEGKFFSFIKDIHRKPSIIFNDERPIISY